MPIIKSAKKALKQNLKKKSRNDRFKALYRESRRSFEKAIEAWELETATNILPSLQSVIAKLAKKNIVHS